jgi:hypothetical protein
MNKAAAAIEVAPADLGERFAGKILIPGQGVYGIIVAPKALGHHDDTAWAKSTKSVPGASSFFDGLANTRAMAEAGSKLAQWALGLAIDGQSDWYLPSRDELELCYRAFKPTTDENYCWRGDNPSSVPVGYAYSPESPAQTEIKAFRKDGAEAFERAWYWTSTQSAGGAGYAWMQGFDDGTQDYGRKSSGYLARAVRRVLINSAI